jgi:hypothetical protein
MRISNCLLAACVIATATPAYATFLYGITRPTFGTGPTDLYALNPATGQNRFVLNFDATGIPSSAPGFNGMAADDANRRVFAITNATGTSTLFSLAYPSLTPTQLGGITRADTGGSIFMSGLAFDSRRNVLYAVNDLASTTLPESIWRVDLTTRQATPVLQLETSATSNFFIGGFDYDAQTDRLYLADDDDTGGRNLYWVDPADPSALNLLAAYPAGVTDVDGIGAGNGQLFLLSDALDRVDTTTTVEGNGGLHRVFDIATLSVVNTFPTPYPEPNRATLGVILPTGAAAFTPNIPEPTTLVASALAAGITLRRRRASR